MAAPARIDVTMFGEDLDLELLVALHRQNRLFLAYQVEGAAEPCTLTLDGDAHDLVDQLLNAALLARTERARSRRGRRAAGDHAPC